MNIYLIQFIDLDSQERLAPACAFSSMEKLNEYIKDLSEDIKWEITEDRDYEITEVKLDFNAYRAEERK